MYVRLSVGLMINEFMLLIAVQQKCLTKLNAKRKHFVHTHTYIVMHTYIPHTYYVCMLAQSHNHSNKRVWIGMYEG